MSEENEGIPKKRTRFCGNCPKCQGATVDKRTAYKHTSNSCSIEAAGSTTESQLAFSLEINVRGDGELPCETFAAPIDTDSDSQSVVSSVDTQSGDSFVDSDPADGNPERERVEQFILRTLKLKVKFGWSREETLLQLQSFFEYEPNNDVPYSSWDNVLQFLKEIGYRDAKHLHVCSSQDHVELLEEEMEECPICKKLRKDCMDYFILGINLQDLFLNSQTIEDITAHWKSRAEWFNVRCPTPKRELWHGDRFSELSYFWDETEETLLPAICEHCNSIISTDVIKNHRESAGIMNDRLPVPVKCPDCLHSFQLTPAFMTGHPLNQAFLFHEDGFNAFFKKSRGVATIQLSNACIFIEKRLSGDFFQVYSFIPTFNIKDGITHKLDAFFKPLFDEVTKLYIVGIPIEIRTPMDINGYQLLPGQHQVRALLLLGTADMKAHQEIALYTGGGRMGCRRCLVAGTYVAAKRHYYYGEFGVRYRDRPGSRTADYLIEHGTACDNAPNIAQRQALQVQFGVKGVSVLFHLYSLYGFDPVQDMTTDRMHACFNMLKREFLDYIWADLGDNRGRDVNSRVPEDGGLIDRNEFSDALQAVPWTTEQKASGVARLKSLTDRLGGWKTAEFNKFSQVAKEVLATRIPSKAYDSFVLLCQATQMLYSKQLQHDGWNEENVKRLDDLLWAHAIRFEEFYALDHCTENLEYSTHLASDINRHSSPDNYSCELFERSIRVHKQQKNNAKGIEKTLIDRECLRQFLISYERKNGPLSRLQNTQQYRFDRVLLDSNVPFFLREHSFKAAQMLIKEFSATENASMEHALSYGVCVGKMQRRFMSPEQHSDINRYLKELHPCLNVSVPRVGKSLKSIVKNTGAGDPVKFQVGDTCIVFGGPDMDEEWIMKITQFIHVGPVAGKYYNFLDGVYYIPAFHPRTRQWLVDPWTKCNQLVPKEYNRLSTQPVSRLSRKCLLYPEPSELTKPQYFLCVAFLKPEAAKPVFVPVYPKVGDDLRIKGPRNDEWFGSVVEVDMVRMLAKVDWYYPTARHNVWTLRSNVDTIHFSAILQLVQFRRAPGGPRKFCLLDQYL